MADPIKAPALPPIVPVPKRIHPHITHRYRAVGAPER